MRRFLIAGLAVGALCALGSCASMSKEECLAGDWTGRGYADGAAGATPGRLGEHAEACARHGVVPDDASYRSGWSQGVLTYCTPERGFAEGRQGNSYGGVCPADLAARFVPAWEDGRTMYVAESAVTTAVSTIESHAARLEDLDDKLDAKQRELRAEGLTDEQRDIIRNRIREIRREREGEERSWRLAQDVLVDATREASAVRRRLERIYGGW